MPRLNVVQLVLVELAAAAAAAGIATKDDGGPWLIIGIAVGVVLLALAAVPVGGRWLYQLGLSLLTLIRRRRGVRGPGLQSLLGGFQVTTIPAGRQGTSFGAVAVAKTWTVPLEVTLDRVLNDDAPIPVDQLATLLRVEDVPMASVRLVTVVSPTPRGDGPALPVPAPPLVVVRYVLLTLDLATASAAVASRGGTNAAVAQILRRCALRAEEVLAANGLAVRRLDEPALAGLFTTLFGPLAGQAGGAALPPTVETWREIRVAGTWSMTFAIGGAGADLADRVTALAAAVSVPIAVTSLVLRRTGRGSMRTTMLLRISGPGRADRSLATGLAERARETGLVLQRLDGEQGALLRATTPVGVGAAS